MCEFFGLLEVQQTEVGATCGEVECAGFFVVLFGFVGESLELVAKSRALASGRVVEVAGLLPEKLSAFGILGEVLACGRKDPKAKTSESALMLASAAQQSDRVVGVAWHGALPVQA